MLARGGMAMKRIASMLVFVALLVFFAAPEAPGQVLNNTWFSVKAAAKGYVMDLAGEIPTPASFSTTCYLHLLPGSVYTYENSIYCQDASGEWLQENWSAFRVNGTDDGIGFNWQTSWYNGDRGFEAYSTVRIAVKKNSSGAVTKAAFKSIGCVVSAALFEERDFYGGCSLKGKLVDEDDLPFNP